MQPVARWFVESVGLHAGCDLWELARRWGFSVRVRRGGSGTIPRDAAIVWVDASAFATDPAGTLALALAEVAIEVAETPADPEAVARWFLGASAKRA